MSQDCKLEGIIQVKHNQYTLTQDCKLQDMSLSQIQLMHHHREIENLRFFAANITSHHESIMECLGPLIGWSCRCI